AAHGRIAAAFCEEAGRGHPSGTAVGEDLYDAGHGVGAVERALRAVDDLDLIDVVEGEIGIIEVAAGVVHGRAIDEQFAEAGIAAVEENGREAADPAGACDGEA